MFTQACFIRKCSPTLIEKLVELGYKIIGDSTLSYGIFCNNGKIKICSINEQPSIKDKDFIQCYDNEELFIALAALRDDNDYMQWFVSQAEKDSPKVFIKSTTHSCTQSLAYTHRWDWRCSKASVEELIEHFNK